MSRSRKGRSTRCCSDGAPGELCDYCSSKRVTRDRIFQREWGRGQVWDRDDLEPCFNGSCDECYGPS